jgi:hypothetical protein
MRAPSASLKVKNKKYSRISKKGTKKGDRFI